MAGFLPDAASILYPYKYVNKTSPPVSAPSGFNEDILAGADGLKIVSWSKKCAEPVCPTVIYLHGNGESLADLVTTEKLNWLVDSNVNFVDYDYPKYGHSEGDLDEHEMIEAAKLVLESTLKNFANTNIFIVGRSLGAGIAMQLMAQPDVQSRVTGLILISAWTSVEECGKLTHPMLAKMVSPVGNEYQSLNVAPGIQVPTLLFHGTSDKTVPVQLGEKLAAAFPAKNIEVHILPGLDHNQMLEDVSLQANVKRFIGLASTAPN